jgi:hypothetical protein
LEAVEAFSSKPNHQLWEPLLLAAGYEFAYFDGLNRWYVQVGDPRKATRFLPPNNWDEFRTYRELELEVRLHKALAAS